MAPMALHVLALLERAQVVESPLCFVVIWPGRLTTPGTGTQQSTHDHGWRGPTLILMLVCGCVLLPFSVRRLGRYSGLRRIDDESIHAQIDLIREVRSFLQGRYEHQTRTDSRASCEPTDNHCGRMELGAHTVCARGVRSVCCPVPAGLQHRVTKAAYRQSRARSFVFWMQTDAAATQWPCTEERLIEFKKSFMARR
jgi:hypothetical protein